MLDLTGQRMTLISDPSPEFPNNTNVSFKVRLQTPLDLRNPNWEVALVSLSVPNRGVGMKELGYTSATDAILKATYWMREVVSGVLNRRWITVTAGDVFSADFQVATSGAELWTRVANVMHDKIERELGRFAQEGLKAQQYCVNEVPFIGADKTKDLCVLNMHPTSRNQPRVSIDLKFAKTFGLVYESNGTYVRNVDVLKASLPSIDDNGQDVKRQSSFNQPKYYSFDRDGFLQLNSNVTWTIFWLERHFNVASSTNARSILVYSDMVQSTIMGGQRHHLLRELFLPKEEYDERQMVEPNHYQWIPISKMRTEIVEVELADLNGKLLKLPQGKTLVTVAVRQMER